MDADINQVWSRAVRAFLAKTMTLKIQVNFLIWNMNK